MIKKRRKICVVTGTRAEYGLLFWLLKEIKKDKSFKLQVVITGMHLSPEFGLTYKEIIRNFKVDKSIELLLSSDTPVGISKSIGLGQISFCEAFKELNPDIVVLLGDRYEIFAAATAAMISKIPIAHIHGGESTEGLIDEAIRHSITKMSQIHFASTEDYRKRVIQIGENPNRVFNFGSLGVENIRRHKLLNKKDFQKSIGFMLNKKNILITFHPVTLENNTTKKQFQELLDALSEIKNTNFIFTLANSDTHGRIINEMIKNYVNKNLKNSFVTSSFGQVKYLSALKFVDLILGNSSSGIIEAPSFKIATINIGDRQKGRIKAKSVIDTAPLKKDIKKSIEKVYTEKFQKMLKNVKNPHGGGAVSKKIVKVLKKIKINDLIKKNFYKINF